MTTFEQIQLPDGRAAFRKFLASGQSDCFQAEADGLCAMSATATVRVPEVIQVSNRELLTEWVGGGSENSAGWHELGEFLAAMHALPQPGFGFESDNYCGATPQSNTPVADGWEFFAVQRLLYQGRLARDSGLLSGADCGRLESVAAQLQQLVPEQSPALLHGDLWRGNVVFNREGLAYLIDPAVHRGWPESELAMTCLFGEFDRGFYSGYEERRPLEPDWRERIPLYNLYHLLNHLNIFGGSYHAQVQAILQRYA